MTGLGVQISTDTADIALVAARSIEQRFRPDARFTQEAFEQNRLAREQVSNGRPCGVMIIVPKEIPVHPPSTNEDHFRKERQDGSILALAVVTNSEDVSAVSKFYFRYYPQSFKVQVFDDEDEARQWLADVLAKGV